MNLEEERDWLRRELQGTQQMLAAAVALAGGEVAVPKEKLKYGGFISGKRLDLSETESSFVFKLVDNA